MGVVLKNQFDQFRVLCQNASRIDEKFVYEGSLLVIFNLQKCLWNIFGSDPKGIIEILLTPEDFGTFPTGDLQLRVGSKYKDEVPSGTDETTLATFDAPVSENTKVTVEGDEAWVDLLTRKTVSPFKLFYTVLNDSSESREFYMTGFNGTIEYREDEETPPERRRYVWHLSGPPGTGWDFQLINLDITDSLGEFLYIGGGREVTLASSGIILSNKEIEGKKMIRVANNDAVVYLALPNRSPENFRNFTLNFTRFGNETEMTTTTEGPTTSALPIPSGDPPSITVLLRHPEKKLENLVSAPSSFTNKVVQEKKRIRVASNDAVIYMVLPVLKSGSNRGFSLNFTQFGNETEMTTTTEGPTTSALPIPSGDPPSITVLLRHPEKKLENLVSAPSSFTYAIAVSFPVASFTIPTAHDAETWMYFQNLTKEIARACEDYAKENGLSSTSITFVTYVVHRKGCSVRKIGPTMTGSSNPKVKKEDAFDVCLNTCLHEFFNPNDGLFLLVRIA
ncbi:unnamed protein product [Darwinula stevensoni]|uniref:Uncharacterized protein n=1 Tax=Darwinula stevensoni TaxID=69355 RepID=A0A7R9FS17_9CRUS|nr:unnamed protein product [Darwinula stevensoni]CAG0902573.1 unnamed protein product [Darwinula stevensoni]